MAFCPTALPLSRQCALFLAALSFCKLVIGASVTVSSFSGFLTAYTQANGKNARTTTIILTSNIIFNKSLPLLKKNIGIKGACVGANKKPTRCIIDGAKKFIIFPSAGDRFTPSCSGTLLLQDLIIQNAKNGVFQRPCNASFYRMTFQNNIAFGSSAIADNPGAAQLLWFEDCEFINNFASNASGSIISLYPYSDGNSGPDLKFVQSTFQGNVMRYGEGGAIFAGVGQLYLDGVTFINNTADEGGAFYFSGTYSQTRNCIFKGNTANDGIGADIVGDIESRPPSSSVMGICASTFETKRGAISLLPFIEISTGVMNICQMKTPPGLDVQSGTYPNKKWTIGATGCRSYCAAVTP
eukprot:TRINITY_DN7571_c0_g1_i3.p1 TRINITY_DN7571_c0_g1~~TRINITY_DN7571_c0_g1_i3.p1  ORF type:complete len:371 (-),score=64.30 TRINITY_DN7571_c0_g1_i3:178-1239(-)